MIRLLDAFPLFNWELPLGFTCWVVRDQGRTLSIWKGGWGWVERSKEKREQREFYKGEMSPAGAGPRKNQGQQRGFNTILCTSLSSPLALCSLPCSHHLPFPFPSQLLCFLSPQAPEITNALKQELACVCAVGPHFGPKIWGGDECFLFYIKTLDTVLMFPFECNISKSVFVLRVLEYTDFFLF